MDRRGRRARTLDCDQAEDGSVRRFLPRSVALSASRPRPMPSIQTSLLTAIPDWLGQTLPGLRRAGVRRYIPTRLPANAVSAAPATLLLTMGSSSAAPTPISAADSALRNTGGGTLPRNGKA